MVTTRKPTTEDISGPDPAPASTRGRPALIAVFPSARALPVPPSGDTVGREWLARFGVVDPKVSSEHLSFSRRGGVLRVTDVGARNGTWVNGARLTKGETVTLDDGAVLRAGRTIMVHRTEYGGPDEPAASLGAIVSPFGLWRVRAALARLVKQRPLNVLIEGETGTGKELIARVVADALRPGRSYVAVNVAGIPSGVFESQLFGYEKGAFSGAGAGSPGVFLANERGTVFLDEIGELPLDAQPKLLRLLDNRELLQVGATKARKVDVLVVAATNRSLAEMVDQGTFRRDLLARLDAASLELPPLRERAEDILAIARAALQREPDDIEPEAVGRLMLHDWPANVRALAGAMQRLRGIDESGGIHTWAVDKVLPPQKRKASILTREAAEAALESAGGNESQAARDLGVSRGALIRVRRK